MIRAKDFDEIEMGDKILLQLALDENGVIIRIGVVTEIRKNERLVLCKGYKADILPNSYDQFIVID